MWKNLRITVIELEWGHMLTSKNSEAPHELQGQPTICQVLYLAPKNKQTKQHRDKPQFLYLGNLTFSR